MMRRVDHLRHRRLARYSDKVFAGEDVWTWALLLTPCVCLVATLLLGAALGVASPSATLGARALPTRTLAPVHVFFAMSWVLSSVGALTLLVGGRIGATPSRRIKQTLALLWMLFVALGASSIIMGKGSGAEYLSWTPVLTPLLVAIGAIEAVWMLRRLSVFSAFSAEAAWLLGLGLVLIPLGLIEGSASLLADLSFTKGLSLDWHARDIIFAGWNASLYGLGMLCVGRPRGRDLRAMWLYAIAAFGFVSTFGHHHYLSSQPHTIKLIAVTASMLAGVSFVRHVRSTWAGRSERKVGPDALFLAAQLWTLVAIGSGVLLAIPRVNLLLHGTYAILAHSMGAMIGVNTTIILGCFLKLTQPSQATSVRIATLVRRLNIALALMALDLLAAGVAKGLLRTHMGFNAYQPVVRKILTPLPVFGAALAIVLLALLLTAARSACARSRAQSHGEAARSARAHAAEREQPTVVTSRARRRVG